MHKAAFVAVAFATACHASFPARAGPRDNLEAIARAFDETALRARDSEPSAIIKWATAIRYVVRNDGAPAELEQQARRAITETAALARIPVAEARQSDAEPNFIVNLENKAGVTSQPCQTEMRSTNGRLTQVKIVVNAHRFRGIGYCIGHEVMHGFGFRSHPRDADSILAAGAAHLDYTQTDRLLIRTLYDRRLGPNMDAGAASRVGCRILAESLGVSRWQAEPVCGRRNGPQDGRLTKR